ncbi:major facilitator superfamily transporter [Phlyctema vagabunda]|uniref:Major facilitator superfamily transporter n=1 Tax=Phlyctema vagabunda TaxID=108571 RepID=A0ABR4PEG2_9HELO
MITINHRGAVLSLFSAVDVLAPVVGPFAGGYITSAWGWRWIFYFLAILSGVISIVAFLFLRETYSPVILEQKAKRLRKATGNINLHTQRQNTKPLGSLMSRAFLRPMRILIMSPIVLGLSLYMSLVYGLIYVLFTTLAVVFQGVYGFNTSNSGLTFLGFGGGMVLALLVAGRFNDKIHKKLSEKHHIEKPEFRLPFLIYGALFLPIGMFIYGWTIQARAHWILPLIGTAFAGVGVVFCLVPTQAYIIDAFPLHSASALAGNSLLRSVVGGTLPLAAPGLYAKLGYGWGNSLLAFLALAFGGLPILFYKYGEALRKRYPVKLDD